MSPDQLPHLRRAAAVSHAAAGSPSSRRWLYVDVFGEDAASGAALTEHLAEGINAVGGAVHAVDTLGLHDALVPRERSPPQVAPFLRWARA